jgi:hypothetical protein
MMFGAAAQPAPKPPPTKAEPAAAPSPRPPVAAEAPPPAPISEPPPPGGGRTTQLFGQPPPIGRPDAAPPPLFGAPPAPIAAAAPPALFAEPPVGASPEPIEAQHAAASEAAPAAEPAAADGPPRALLVGVAAAIALVVVAGGIAFIAKTWLHRAPPAAAVEALSEARDFAAKDTMTSLVQAESRARAAAELAPKGYAAALAQLAIIRVAQVDAFYDESLLAGERARSEMDDRKRALAEVLASDLQERGKARLKLAFEAAAAANRLDAKSAEVALALADYYRASRSHTNLARELKRAETLGAPPARLAFVQGADLLADDNPGAAVDKLKVAASASPQGARERFRLAMALVSAQKQSEAFRELQEILRLSPEHERAKAMMEALAAGAPAGAGKQGQGEK